MLSSNSVMSDSLQLYGQQRARLPFPSPSPGACSNSCPSNLHSIQPSCHLLSPSPAFKLSQHQGLFQWVGSSHQVAKVLGFQLQYQSSQWISRTDWLVLSPSSPRKSQESSSTPQFEDINSSVLWLLYGPTLISILDYWKNHSFDYRDFVDKIMFLLLNMLSRFVIDFLPRSEHLLISWLKSPSAVILEPKKIKFVTIFIVSPSIFHWMMAPDAMILVFWMLTLSHFFHSPLSLSSRGSLVPLHSLL